MKKLLLLLTIPLGLAVSAQRQMEYLGRGVIAVRDGKHIFVSWRLLATDPPDQAFDLYRVKDGRIVENWHLEDNLTLLKQLGAIKP